MYTTHITSIPDGAPDEWTALGLGIDYVAEQGVRFRVFEEHEMEHQHVRMRFVQLFHTLTVGATGNDAYTCSGVSVKLFAEDLFSAYVGVLAYARESPPLRGGDEGAASPRDGPLASPEGAEPASPGGGKGATSSEGDSEPRSAPQGPSEGPIEELYLGMCIVKRELTNSYSGPNRVDTSIALLCAKLNLGLGSALLTRTIFYLQPRTPLYLHAARLYLIPYYMRFGFEVCMRDGSPEFYKQSAKARGEMRRIYDNLEGRKLSVTYVEDHVRAFYSRVPARWQEYATNEGTEKKPSYIYDMLLQPDKAAMVRPRPLGNVPRFLGSTVLNVPTVQKATRMLQRYKKSEEVGRMIRYAVSEVISGREAPGDHPLPPAPRERTFVVLPPPPPPQGAEEEQLVPRILIRRPRDISIDEEIRKIEEDSADWTAEITQHKLQIKELKAKIREHEASINTLDHQLEDAYIRRSQLERSSKEKRARHVEGRLAAAQQRAD